MKVPCIVLAVLVASCLAKKPKKDDEKVEYRVTSVATLSVEVKDFNDEGDTLTGDIQIGLFGDLVPMTVLNFEGICQGFKSQNQRKLQYAKSHCHRLVKDMLVQCGDVTNYDGTGTASIFGSKFIDENFKISHASAGVVSMANHGKDTNGSQFFILFGRARYLDNFHVAFGKVLEGMDVLEGVNEMGAKEGSAAPRQKITIKECAVDKLDNPYTLPEKAFLSDNVASQQKTSS